MRRRCRHVFARDEPTAAALRRRGVPASWRGNLMMDALEITGRAVVAAGEGPVVALLPGSRADAYDNLAWLADCLEGLAHRHRPPAAGRQLLGLVPLAPGLAMERCLAVLEERGWVADEPLGGGATVAKPGVRLRLTQGVFGDVVQAADVVIGLAGTANEQAAGLGKPVVAFPGPGVQFGPRFLRAQKRLLGEALAVTPPDPRAVAAEAAALLSDESRRARMAAAGRARMGPPGAAARMAAAIVQIMEDGGQ